MTLRDGAEQKRQICQSCRCGYSNHITAEPGQACSCGACTAWTPIVPSSPAAEPQGGTDEYETVEDALEGMLKEIAPLRQRVAEMERERDLYALLRGICEDVIDWLASLSHEGKDSARNVLDDPLSKEIRLKLQRMYDHPLDDKLLRRTDQLELAQDKLERQCAALREGLEKIAANGECECEHDTEDCCGHCDPIDYVCPECIAGLALRRAESLLRDSQPEEK